MTITYIYLRHAPKEYKNGQAPPGKSQHDSPILEASIARCQNIGRILTDNYGVPNIVIMSPYQRTIQTAKALMNKLTYSIRKQIFVDNNIAEFLGNQRGRIDLTPETYSYNSYVDEQAPLRTGETVEEFKERVIIHLKMLQILPSEEKDPPSPRLDTDRVVWVITHGFVISTIYSILKCSGFHTGCEDKFYPQELEGVVIKIGDLKQISTIRKGEVNHQYNNCCCHLYFHIVFI